ncbi:hypothetical protein CASFOL_017382 [Castilleja foliolosa]|uniref:Uncharacterized protein n=1 Tax=Castilleja foliolosa TaxID=1961234 RepID=A0ABD3DF64_9LAMI
MEGGKKQSGSSLATELFGEKDSLTGSSSGVFGSIFAPPSKVLGRESETKKKNGSGNQAWNPKTGFSDTNFVGGEGQSKNINSYFENENVQPFNYNSSIYYGGQDIYNRPPQPAQNPVFTTFNKDGGEDDSGGASRGNWWQGSLYY